MRKLLNPKWLLFINTLPVIILFFLFVSQFNIIKSLLKPEQILIWKQTGILLGILSVLTIIYTAILIIRKKEISLAYGFIALITYIAFLYHYGYYAEDIIPSNIPMWMVPTDMAIYVGTFLMPSLAHALLVLVIRFTSEKKNHNPLVNFCITAAIPLSWYIFSQLLLPFFKVVEKGFSIHAIIVFIISGTVLFLFFLMRTIYTLALKKSKAWKKYETIWKIPITLIFPIAGLMLNNGVLFNQFSNNGGGFLGNFNSPWFYIIALLNGILLCVPKTENVRLRLALFLLKSITFSYTLYFFLVFLPFLPISIIAVIALGFGFLMLTPLLIFVIHLKDLADDFRLLKQVFPSKKLILAQVGCLMLIPFAITVQNLHHRHVLHEALDYVYNPDYEKLYDINSTSIANTLQIISKQKDRNRDFIFGMQTPYLSSYFNWIVLDNMTLSDKKIKTMKLIFLGDNDMPAYYHFDAENFDKEVEISDARTSSKYDPVQNAWKSQVDFEITNVSGNSQKEFATNFELPAGCWITDYYLYIGNKKENALLIEKKAANWVFSQIVNENRDPGILSYGTGNTIDFKVFPFSANEIRKTGMEFIHKEPITITIDGRKIFLGNEETNASEIRETKNDPVMYVTAAEKNKLPAIQRTPFYYFIIDVSKNASKNKEQYEKSIEIFLNNHDQKETKVCFSNTYATSENLKKDWEKQLSGQEYKGGFYLDRAIKSALFENHVKKEKKYPVIIVLTDSIEKAIIENDFSDFRMTFPESDLFYCLDKAGNPIAHSLVDHPLAAKENSEFEVGQQVLAYPDNDHPIAFLPNDGKASIVLKEPIYKMDTVQTQKQWNTGLQLEGQRMSGILYPEKASEYWIESIKTSFSSKIMCSQTAFISVENEAQKAMLLKKQQQVLQGNKSLDLDEDTQRMSEPGIIWLIVILGGLLILKRRKHLILQLKHTNN